MRWLFLMLFLIGCAPSSPDYLKIVKPDRIIIVRPDTIYISYLGVDSMDFMPIDMADADWWYDFWTVNGYRYWGATTCYGTYGVVTQISPLTPDTMKYVVMDHERIHHLQIRRHTCPVMTRRQRDPAFAALIEAEAFYKGEGLFGEELLDRLFSYRQIAVLGRDSLRIVLKQYMK